MVRSVLFEWGEGHTYGQLMAKLPYLEVHPRWFFAQICNMLVPERFDELIQPFFELPREEQFEHPTLVRAVMLVKALKDDIRYAPSVDEMRASLFEEEP